MCGIGGRVGPDATVAVDEMRRALSHRGPDGDGVWQDPDARATLVHTRLAILDLSSTGAQPMGHDGTPAGLPLSASASHDSGRYWLVFNGEIYNFRELQSQLEAQGETFHSHSDTEILLRLLIRRGKAALGDLAGMFAFAFYDRVTRCALLARDAFGIKPLYYAREGDGLRFASEVRALTSTISERSTPPAVIRDLLLWGTVPEPATYLENVAAIPAGCLLEWSEEGVRLERWHTLRFAKARSSEAPATLTRKALRDSISRHLVSDVPVGIFLSGGIDSTAVLALAREALGPQADLRTFSIGFDIPAYDESTVARRTAAHFGARHTEWLMRAEEGRAEIGSYLEAMDQPTIDGFNVWCVSKLARREGMKVVLSGLGGDELFAGYPSFRHIPRLLELYRLLGPPRAVFARLLDHAAPGSRWRRLAGFLRSRGEPLSAFHVQRGIFTEAEARRLALELTGSDPGPVDWNVPDLPSDPADAVSYLELTRYMRNQLLRDADVFSMAHGLELRVPFVDAGLFEAVATIPSASRLRQGKRLLLEAVPEVPSWVREQSKRGFLFPFQEWMQGQFGQVLAAADRRTNVPLVTWYRRWALAATLMKA